MKFTVSITSNDNTLRLGLETADTSFLGESISSEIESRCVEIVEVILDRELGKGLAGMALLDNISSVIANVFIENKNSILFFYCDDLNEIPRCRTRNISPQEYRSNLFSLMFERYVTKHGIQSVHDVTIRVNAIDHPLFFHFISRDEHMDIIDEIKDDFAATYSK
ncbi:MAG: hypothetical protein ACI4TK_10660 [Agathobacter sp.]